MTKILVGLWLKQNLQFEFFRICLLHFANSLISSSQRSSCQIQIQMIIRQSSKSHQHQIVICLVITYFSHLPLDFSSVYFTVPSQLMVYIFHQMWKKDLDFSNKVKSISELANTITLMVTTYVHLKHESRVPQPKRAKKT